ncbi:MAG: hypothetical protein MZV65_43050 [Chromatiales bacterium]|nr:hypothetical protein [Chromatiales bacterium]
MKESDIQRAVMLAASSAGLTVWRNNTGQAWAGNAQRLQDGSILIRNPRPLHAGLCKGSSGLIGLRRVLVTPEMVGRTDDRAVHRHRGQAPGQRPTPEQAHFLEFVRDAGGLALVARSPDDIRHLGSQRK